MTKFWDKFLLTSALERPKSSMIPDAAGDEYPVCKQMITHFDFC